MPRVTTSRAHDRAARPVRRVVATAIGAFLVAAGLAPPASAAEVEIRVAASATVVDLGASVRIDGTLVGSDEGCVRGRAVSLEWRPADRSSFGVVADGVADADGRFAFEHVESSTGRYRVSAPVDGACPEAVSATVGVGVRARVDGGPADGSVTAGACVDVTASVAPPKPGQVLELQRRADGSWSTIETLTLDAASSVTSRRCFAWDEAGVVRLRLLWRPQDPLNETGRSAVLPLRVELAPWMARIEDIVGGRDVSVSVGEDGTFLYGIEADAPRIPASNEKLLLSMAMLSSLGPAFRIRTTVAVDGAVGPVVHGDLWLLGRGDPEVDRRTMIALARQVVDAGIERIDGRVLGSTTYFRRDWDAPGWNDRARAYVARPTALVFGGNLDERGRNLREPEARAAAALVRELERVGVAVRGRPGAGPAPEDLAPVGRVGSRTLRSLLVRLLRPSDNFFAEVLGKRLGVATSGTGSIASAAAAIRAFAAANGVDVEANDSSGLSYANRVTAEDLVRLLWVAEAAPWGSDLLEVLPTGGQGTLRHRLGDVRIRAKTGTLTDVSALSGWIWLEPLGTWGEFSILSHGMSKWVASDLEDRIVRILQEQAGVAGPSARSKGRAGTERP